MKNKKRSLIVTSLLFVFACLMLFSGCTALDTIKTSLATANTMKKADEALVFGDFSTAAKEYRAAARPENGNIRQGNPEAQYWLALLYNYGKGVKRDKAQALNWMRASADNGYPPGQLSFGLWTLIGYGKNPDIKTGIRYIKAAADQGDPDALYLLASMTNQGALVKKDKHKTKTLYAKALDEGFPVPQQHLPFENTEKKNGFWSRISGSANRQPDKTISHMSRRQRVREIQKGLRHLGFNPGPVDGLMGKKTATAIRAFEQSRRMKITGEPSTQVYDAIHSEKN